MNLLPLHLKKICNKHLLNHKKVEWMQLSHLNINHLDKQNTQVPACSASQFYKHTGKNKPRVF